MINYSSDKKAIKCDSYYIGDKVRIQRGADLFDAVITSCKSIYREKTPCAYKVNVYWDDEKNWIEAEYIVGLVRGGDIRYYTEKEHNIPHVDKDMAREKDAAEAKRPNTKEIKGVGRPAGDRAKYTTRDLVEYIDPNDKDRILRGFIKWPGTYYPDSDVVTYNISGPYVRVSEELIIRLIKRKDA